MLSKVATASMAMVCQKWQSLVSVSEGMTDSSIVGNRISRLPFCEEAPIRPNQLNHHTTPRALHLSPMQCTPMQVHKWRTLAATAQPGEERKQVKFG